MCYSGGMRGSSSGGMGCSCSLYWSEMRGRTHFCLPLISFLLIELLVLGFVHLPNGCVFLWSLIHRLGAERDWERVVGTSMAGILPGVECARRRRFHQSSTASSDSSPMVATHGLTRRSSFCLYTTNFNQDTHVSSSFSSLQRNKPNHAYPDEKLGGVAKMAKDRLDERLKPRPKSQSNREISSKTASAKELQKDQAIESKKNSGGSRRFNWVKMKWKNYEQEDCAVCLDMFRDGESLAHLPCAHKFHSRCLLPWLEKNDHCPCCRTRTIS